MTYFSELALIFSRKEREIMWSLAVKKAFRFRFIVGEGRRGGGKRQLAKAAGLKNENHFVNHIFKSHLLSCHRI